MIASLLPASKELIEGKESFCWQNLRVQIEVLTIVIGSNLHTRELFCTLSTEGRSDVALLSAAPACVRAHIDQSSSQSKEALCSLCTWPRLAFGAQVWILSFINSLRQTSLDSRPTECAPFRGLESRLAPNPQWFVISKIRPKLKKRLYSSNHVVNLLSVYTLQNWRQERERRRQRDWVHMCIILCKRLKFTDGCFLALKN